MKVLMLNGSPNAQGCTYTALAEVAGALSECGVKSEIVHAIKKPIHSCIACHQCAKTNRCVFTDDGVNDALDMMETCDGLVIGSPVYYASPNGAFLAFLDRMFYTRGGNMPYKPGASVVSARRAGTSASLDVLAKYFLNSNMPIVPSQYWTMVHGARPEQVREDEEGMQTMRTLGRNMAWMLNCIKAGGPPPAPEEPRRWTNFIR